ncbi:MAG TPA: hypothetical protein VGC77_10090 [Rhodopseudomonas sp.]|uniref:hypothetical protein n=1 Tax=Rhodopseudomonas sp. TaxID=1078 RepID=UPI002EDB38CD
MSDPTYVEDDVNEDGAIVEAFAKLIFENARALAKAPVAAIMSAFTVAVLSGSLAKGVFVGVICLFASLFNTWRRFIEPISFWFFLISIAFWCDPDIVNDIKLALAWTKIAS